MSKERALAVAKEQPVSADLILVSIAGDLPVCRLMERKVVKQRMKQEHPKEKEMRFSSRIDQHDLGTKTRRVLEFLEKGHPVKLVVSIQARGVVGVVVAPSVS